MRTFAMCRVRIFVAGLVLSVAPFAVLAQGSAPGCELGDYDPTQRPDPEGKPTEVGIGVYVVNIDRVDNVEQSFRLDAFLRQAWQDPRLAAAVNASGLQQCRFPLAEVWQPRVIVFNRQDANALLPEVVTVDSEGDVLYLQRAQSTLAPQWT